MANHETLEYNPNFSDDQWAFLAALEALGSNVSIQLIGDLVPLPPGPLFDLLGQTEKNGILEKAEGDRLILAQDLPPAIKKRIQQINTPEHISDLAGTIINKILPKKVVSHSISQLLNKAGYQKDAGKLEMKLAFQAIKEGENKMARFYFKQALDWLIDSCENPESNTLFIKGALQYSNISFYTERNIPRIHQYLKKAHELADKLGDRRSVGMINLHFGRLFYSMGKRESAIMSFAMGFEEIRKLGDDDIITQSSVFLGIYFFIQGKFREALEYLEKAETLIETEGSSVPFVALVSALIGYCSIYLGQFHRAIGNLDFNWRLARERSDLVTDVTLRAVLGTVLALLKRNNEALLHLEQVQKDASTANSVVACYTSDIGMSVYYYINGDIKNCYKMAKKSIKDGRQSGLIKQFIPPLALEMIYEFHRSGFEPIPDFGYHDVVERICPKDVHNVKKEINIHHQGIALRLRAKNKIVFRKDKKSILEDLSASEELLRQSGDPVELSKTLLEQARFELSASNHKKARELVQQAWRELGGYTEEFFPDDLRQLLEDKGAPRETTESSEAFLKRYLETLEVLIPTPEPNEILGKVVKYTNRLFGAERGGLFWFPGGKKNTNGPELVAARNLAWKQVNTTDFRPYLSMILQAFRTQQPALIQPQAISDRKKGSTARAVLCIPIEIQGVTKGVMYHDNSYLIDAFDFLDTTMLVQLGRYNSMIIERLMQYIKVEKQSQILDSEKTLHFQDISKNEIIYRSSIMSKLLDQAEHVARTDSTVLLLSESGTGKELLAKRIHQQSSKRDGPLIIVDSTTIPENLFESELFGHEKGAFTGADRRKVGYIELAHQGTLFLDEIGELPLQIQTKLLRILQEKTFARVGGTRKLKSDFRLIAATNRDLANEVAEGRFREDLYYRLNVVPLILPPLRKRENDAALLAQFFIKRYCKKYGYQDLKLAPYDRTAILKYSWPGNVRELENVIERAVILSKGDALEINLPVDKPSTSTDPFSSNPTLDEIQRQYIQYVIDQTNGKISGPGGATEILGMKRTSLYSRMKTLGMKS